MGVRNRTFSRTYWRGARGYYRNPAGWWLTRPGTREDVLMEVVSIEETALPADVWAEYVADLLKGEIE